MYLGGAININTNENTTQAIILEILSDEETRILPLTMNPWTPAYLFTVEFNIEKFAKYFDTLLPGATIPKVLLLKLMAYEFLSYSSSEYAINNYQFTNEIKQHINLTSHDKTFPICPSFLYDEKICTSGKYTQVGEAIKGILTKFNLYSNYTKDMVRKLQALIEHRNEQYCEQIPINRVSMHIVIMEYYSCQTLSSFLKSRVTPKIPKLSNLFLYGIPLKSMNYDEFSCFITLFVTILMLVRGFIHGDLHMRNILICIDKNNITPVVIDFGRTTNLSSRDFKFDNKIIKIMSRTLDDDIMLSPPIHNIFENTFDHLLDTMVKTTTLEEDDPLMYLEQESVMLNNSVHKFILSLLKEKLLVEASIVSSMCCTSLFDTSVFYFFLTDPPEHSSYKHMYYCKNYEVTKQKSVWNEFNTKFLQLLEARKLFTSLNYSSINVESLNGKSRLMTSIGLLTKGAKTALSRLTSRLTTKRNAGKRNKLKKIKATKRRH